MKQILVADDSLVTQLSLVHILESTGYQVHVVNDGQSALTILHNQHIDLLISDISMPVMDGLSLLELIRHENALCRLPVILVTGTQEQLQQAQASSANAVLTKPVSSWQVVENVALALESG